MKQFALVFDFGWQSAILAEIFCVRSVSRQTLLVQRIEVFEDPLSALLIQYSLWLKVYLFELIL